MSAFEPLNPDHAIAAVAFGLYFNRPLTAADIAKAKQIEPVVKDFLPGTSSFGGGPPGSPFAGFSLPGLPFPSLPTGIVFQRVKPDATPDWMLTAQQNFAVAQCMNYTRWADVWGRVRAWFTQMYDLIKSQDLFVQAVSLQYKDQFSATKPLDNHCLDKLFRTNSPYLPPHTFRNEELWHVNQGWYVPATEPISGKKLNVLNIATRESSNSIVLVIDHLFRYEMDDRDLPLFANRADGALIEVVMEHLHEQNKSLLRDLLSTQMAQRIRLDG